MSKKTKTPSKKEVATVDLQELQTKHYRALELLESGVLTNKEIAKATNIPTEDFDALLSGNSKKIGPVADLFQSEVRRIHKRNTEMVRFLAKDCTKLALSKMNEHLRVLQDDDLSEDNLKKLIAVVNALAKSTPKVEIGQLNQQFNTYNQFTPAEMHSEYKRLTNLANNIIFGRRKFSRAAEGGAGELPSGSE